MPDYSARDFAAARFATRDHNGRECRAVRLAPLDERDVPRPWTLDCTEVTHSDEDMAHGGWIPIRNIVPKEKPAAQLDRIEALLGKIAENTEPKWIRNVVSVSPRESARLARIGAIADRSLITFD